MKRLLILLVCLVFTAWPVWAGNAGWYRWESRLEGRFVCAQTSPGEGWKQIAGPFRDSSCSKPR
jgi:hypothetical protein